ncbi:hypothetical protein, partial [Methylophaga sp. UBA2012]
MINLTDPMLEFLAYELALVFAIIAGILLVSNRRKQRKVHNASSNAVKKIKRNREVREQNLSQVLQEKYGLSDEALKVEVNDFLERERRIQKSLVKTYIEQDSNAFLNIPDLIEQAVDAALNIEPVGSHSAPHQAEKQASTEADLQQQIDHAAQTMERLLSQYQQLTGAAAIAGAAALPQTEENDAVIDEDSSESNVTAEVDQSSEPVEEQAFGDEHVEDVAFNEQADETAAAIEEEPAFIPVSDEITDTETQVVSESSAEEPLLSNDELDALLDGEDFSLEDENSDTAEPGETNELSDAETVAEPAYVVEINGDGDEPSSVQQQDLTEEELKRFTEISDDIEIPGAVDDILASLQDTEENLQPSVETASATEIDNDDIDQLLAQQDTIAEPEPE